MEKDYLEQKWLQEPLTAEEQIAFDALEDAALNKVIIEHASQFKASHFSTLKGFEDLETHIATPSKVKSISWKRTLLNIASVLVLGFVVYYTYLYDNLTTVTTLAAEKTTISLPDASEVMLNAASEISYDASGWKDNRALNLDGEAFFKVFKGKKFDVKTKDGIVTVLGTQFNVKQRKGYFEITCFEGLVQVTTNDTIKKLPAGTRFTIANGTYQTSSIQKMSPSWIQKTSTFKGVELLRVIEELERQYAITITYEGSKRNELFTGGFPHDNLKNALEAVTKPLKLTYFIENNTNIIFND